LKKENEIQPAVVAERLQRKKCKQRKNTLFKAIDAHFYSNDLKKTKLWRQVELLRFTVQRIALNKNTGSCYIC
jgi:hypothetical protein